MYISYSRTSLITVLFNLDLNSLEDRLFVGFVGFNLEKAISLDFLPQHLKSH